MKSEKRQKEIAEERKAIAAKALAEHKHPFLLGLLNRREKNGEDTMPRVDGVVIRPEHSTGLVHRAAHAQAEWDNSDPFAFGRTALHIRQGFIDPVALVKEVTLRVIARRAAKVREVEESKHVNLNQA